MIKKKFDTVIIGAGAAGMTAALKMSELGFSAAIIERDSSLGGVLNQCIHNGFGLHYFGEELTGPEYAGRLAEKVKKSNIELFLNSIVAKIEKTGCFTIVSYSENGILILEADSVILAMGCRERNRGNIGISGYRPAGIFTAGLAQRLINMEGFLPGTNAVVIGSGDIGLIMSRRLRWCGCKVSAVVEILPYPSGLTRNIVQCLNDFDIPLYLSHSVTQILGRNRVEGVTVSPVVNGNPDQSNSFTIPCDTVLLSVGLIPENELSRAAGVAINPETGGALIDHNYMTSVSGIFSCGNVLHVHDLVDYVSEESETCAGHVSDFLRKTAAGDASVGISVGSNLKYVIPSRVSVASENTLYMRPLIVKKDAVLTIKIKDTVIKEKRMQRVQPSEMIKISITPDDIRKTNIAENSTVEISIS